MPTPRMLNHLMRLERLLRGPRDEIAEADIDIEHHWVLEHLEREEELAQVAIRARLRALGLRDGQPT